MKLYYFLKVNYTEQIEDIEYIYCENESDALDTGAQKFGYKDYEHLCQDVSDDISYTCGVVNIDPLRADIKNKLGSLLTTNNILVLITDHILELIFEDNAELIDALLKSIEANKETINYLNNLGK